MTNHKNVIMSREPLERGFDYVDGKHIPTLKISLNPCDPDDNSAWKARDLLGEKIKTLLVPPVVDLQNDKCTSCDGSGEYIDAIGDWRGYCSCAAGVELKNKQSPPVQLSIVLPERLDESQYRGTSLLAVRGWNSCLEKVKELNK